MYDIKYEEYREDRWWPRIVAGVLGVLLVGVLAWFILRSSGSDDAAESPETSVPVATDEPASDPSVAGDDPAADGAVEGGPTDETSSGDDSDDAAAPEDAPPATDGPDTAGAPVDTAPPAEENADTEPPVASDAPAPIEPTAPPSGTQAPDADPADGGTAPATIAPPAGADGSYPTLPDGSPAPVVAVFGADQITITGAVPDQAAKDRLQALAVANAKPGQATNIANFVSIDPDVPAGVGVRVVELTSVRFPEGSAEVLPAHAQELDRVVAIMNALPNVTALVIGHADQRGDAGLNYELSAARAEAVVNYLAFSGITPDRLASRAVGEADLLTLNNDDAALALNRRTEFVFYGLLLE